MKNKDFAYDDFVNMIVKSWTYERLTDNEKNRAIDALRRMEILHAVYFSYLLALDYKPVGWRE